MAKETSPLDHYKQFLGAADALSDVGSKRLEAVLHQPIEEPGESQVADWYIYVRGAFPLWSFSRNAFNTFYPSISPTTYPLVDLVQSVARDEDSLRGPGTLLHTLRMRRYLFMSGIEAVRTWGVETERRLGVNMPSSAGAYWYQDMRPYTDDWSYAVVGRDLMMHLEAVQHARGSTERRVARDKLDLFLHELLGTRNGRPTEGPSDDLAKALVLGGKRLFELLWDTLSFGISEQADETLREALGEEGKAASMAAAGGDPGGLSYPPAYAIISGEVHVP